MGPIRRKTWTWRFDRAPEAIWPLLADTARFNEAADLPKYEVEEIPRADRSVLYLGRLRFGPIRIEWEEQPANWIDDRWFEHCRRFRNGPIGHLCATLVLIPEEGGCRGEYTLEARARNLLGRILLATVLFRHTGRTFSALATSAREYAGGRRRTVFDGKPPALAPGGAARAGALVARIEATRHGHGLARRLADCVLTRPEVDVWTIRPLALARRWEVPERHAIEVCLEAVKQGLLGLRWDLLCPRCQVGKRSVLSLDELPRGAHCPSCNIDYGRDYAKNVELAFHPARAIRPLEGGEYCLFGPMSTPHIKVHLTLAPGEERTEEIRLVPGRYRLRTLEPGGEATVDWRQGGFPEVVATATDVRAGAPAGPDRVRLRNRADRALTLIVEELVWRRDALTAHRVTTLQAFRDLFTDEVLRPGDNVEIDHIVIMFTDLKGSTALYERIGDPAAYALVREHFAILGRAVRAHDGTIVKTIGDAIMAVFTNAEDALRCAIRIHADFEAFNATSGREPVTIKLGMHLGRCISVTLNNRLDYYGTAANMAARLEGQSRGGDIVISREFAADPSVARILADLPPRREEARLKGYAAPVPFFRLPAEALAARRGEGGARAATRPRKG